MLVKLENNVGCIIVIIVYKRYVNVFFSRNRNVFNLKDEIIFIIFCLRWFLYIRVVMYFFKIWLVLFVIV